MLSPLYNIRNKMKIYLSFFCLLLVHQGASAQNTVSLDQLSFIEPVNWTFTDNGSYHTYSAVNKASNTFCIISVYTSDVSSGNINEDFKRAWKGIIAGHFTVTKNVNPQQLISANGLHYSLDEAIVSNSQSDFFARLLVFSLEGKSQAVLFLFSNNTGLTQYKTELDNFMSSINAYNKSSSVLVSVKKDTSTIVTNFDDGWVAEKKEDYVLLTRNSDKVYLFYAEKFTDENRDNTTDYFYTHQVLKEYTITNVHARSDMYKYVIEGDAIEKSTGRPCYVVMNVVTENGVGKNVLEVAPTLSELIQQIGIDFKKMLTYNRFGVTVQNIQGTWKAGSGASQSYYDYYTGSPTGASAAVTSDKFIFNDNGTYEAEFKGAYGMVGNLKTYQQHEKGSLSAISPWQISTIDQSNNNKTVVYDCWLEAIKGGMILHFVNHQYTGTTYDLLKQTGQ
jgi:hypothetical protein